MTHSPVLSRDLRGYSRLIFDTVGSTTDLVEAMHAGIARAAWPGQARADGRTRGITGFVYSAVRGVTATVGEAVDLSLSGALPLAEELFGSVESDAARDTFIAVLNGVLGDYLERSGNPLAQPMQLTYRDTPLLLEARGGARRLPEASTAAAVVRAAVDAPKKRLLVMLHGLCMSDRQWTQAGYDHGKLLARKLDASLLRLRYNSGRHVSVNGRELAHCMEALVAAWPVEIEEVVFVGHSMGGLLARSACYYAEQAALHWRGKLKAIVFLATPHHGAPLERGGNWLQTIVGRLPYVAPLARLGTIRSAGVTDLRYGNLLDEDWARDDRFSRNEDTRGVLGLPQAVRCLAVAATLGAHQGDIKDRSWGDGLVPPASALGEHPQASRRLAFADNDRVLYCRTGHFGVLTRRDLGQHVGRWLSQVLAERAMSL